MRYENPTIYVNKLQKKLYDNKTEKFCQTSPGKHNDWKKFIKSLSVNIKIQ